MNSANRQVYVELNGYVIQTSLQTYKEYYKLIGWRIIGRANELPIEVELGAQLELSLKGGER